MRIQLNKLGLPSPKDSPYQSEKSFFRKKFLSQYPAFEKISAEGIHTTHLDLGFEIEDKGVEITHICPNCGTELFGDWDYVQLNKKKVYYKNDSYGGAYYISDLYDFKLCGYTHWHDKIVNETIEQHRVNTEQPIAEEIINIAKLEKCPICCSKLIKQFPYIVIIGGSDVYVHKKNKIFSFMSNYDKIGKEDLFPARMNVRDLFDNYCSGLRPMEKYWNIYENEAKDKSRGYISMCDAVYSAKPTTDVTNAMLKDYTYNLINLESNIMCLSQRLEQLYIQKAYNDKDVVFEHNYALYDLRQDIDSKNSLIKNSKKELSNFEKQPISFKKKEYPSKPVYPTLKTPHFFNKKKVEAKNSQALHDYEMAIDKYNSDIEQCDIENEKRKNKAEKTKLKKIKDFEQKIESQSNELSFLKEELKKKEKNNNTPSKALGEKHLLDSEIKTAEETLKELFKCRNELYSYNIVFEKYRNIVALSTFYEYLMAGRCETLDGVNGAYNIYENELRLNTIITKLDEIKENQFIIYNKLRDIDSSLNALNNTMATAVSSLDTISKNTSDMKVYLDDISKNTAVIAHNSAVTAYYSKVNAELTNALGFMVALK